MSDIVGLYAKMATIMGELERLTKDGKSDQLRYKFVRDADVFDTVREQLARYNIAFFPAVTGYDQTPITSKNGAAGYHTVISLEFTFVCGDTGETFKSLWAGESDSYDDKGISKAITLAQKTFLLKTFVLSTGDPNDDPDSRNEEAAHRGARPQPTPKPTTKPAPQNAPRATPAPKPFPADEPPASASELDEFLGPRKSPTVWNPADDAGTFDAGAWAKLNAYMCQNMPHIKASEHAANALWVAIREHIDDLLDDEKAQAAMRVVVEEKSFARLFKAKLTVADVYEAIQSHYASKPAA